MGQQQNRPLFRRGERPRSVGRQPTAGRGTAQDYRGTAQDYPKSPRTADREQAALEGYALAHCYAYSDSITDLPMLSEVGHPALVNPDRALRKEAGERAWPVLSFSRAVSLRGANPGTVGRRGRNDGRSGGQRLDTAALAYSLTSAALRRLSF